MSLGIINAKARAKVFTTAFVKERIPFNKALKWTVNRDNVCCIHTSLAFRGKVIPFILPDIGEGTAEMQIKEWYIKEGDRVKQFDNICEVQSDKATVVITSRYSGIIRKIHYEVDDYAKVGTPLVDIYDEEDDKISPQSEAVEENKFDTVPRKTSDKQKTSAVKPLTTPAVRKIASDNNIDIGSIKGTGKDGRILKEDIFQHMEAEGLTYKENKKLPLEANDKIMPITGYKRTMVKTMTKSGKIPQFGYCDEVRMDALISLRKKIKEIPQYENVTYLPFMIKALSRALMSHPELNAVVPDDVDSVIYKGSHNIGVAVDTQNGLVVPNIKNVQAKDVLEVSSELNRLTALAHQQKLRPSDINGGTFTLSNIGAIGGTYTKPLLLPPEVAIGGFGRIQVIPKYTETGDIVKGHVMHVSWSADHRVIDGALLARFSNLWRSFIENPEMMIPKLK